MLLIALWFQFGILGLCICSIIFEDTDSLLLRDIWFVLLGPIIFAGAIVLLLLKINHNSSKKGY